MASLFQLHAEKSGVGSRSASRFSTRISLLTDRERVMAKLARKLAWGRDAIFHGMSGEPIHRSTFTLSPPTVLCGAAKVAAGHKQPRAFNAGSTGFSLAAQK